jgi:hypothetical protein
MKLFSFLDLFLYYNTALSEIFGKDNEVILHKKFNYIHKFWNLGFLKTHSDQRFLLIA